MNYNNKKRKILNLDSLTMFLHLLTDNFNKN